MQDLYWNERKLHDNVIDDSLSLCGCRFILRFRRESKLKSLLLHTNSKTSGVGWGGVGWGGARWGGVWCKVGKVQWISFLRKLWPYCHDLLAYVIILMGHGVIDTF